MNSPLYGHGGRSNVQPWGDVSCKPRSDIANQLTVEHDRRDRARPLLPCESSILVFFLSVCEEPLADTEACSGDAMCIL